MSNDIQLGNQSSFILAEGKRGRSFGLWWWIAAGIVSFLTVFLIILIAFLHKPIRIPDSDAVFVTASPRSLRQLHPSLLAVLPEEMDEIIETKSRWPVVFSLYRADGRWQWQVIGPRWLIKDETSSNGLIAVYQSSVKNTEHTRSFHYTKALTALLPFKKAFAIEIEPQLLVEASGLNISLEEKPINGSFEKDLLLLDIPFETPNQHKRLHTADLALTIPKNGITEDAIQDFIRRLSNGRHHQLNVPELSQYHVWLDELGRPELTTYTFEEPLTEEDAAQLLGAYGFYSRKATLLPDGTLSYEHVVPSTSTGALFGDHVNEQGELISLKRQELLVQKSDQTPVAFESVPACNHTPWMRVSGKSLAFILGSVGVNGSNLPDELPNLQIGSMNQHLSVCFE